MGTSIHGGGTMDANNAARTRLRTKTGCLTCRHRRVKCDEARPTCKRCGLAKRCCDWPKEDDLLDRRFLAHDYSRHGNRPDVDAVVGPGHRQSPRAPKVTAATTIITGKPIPAGGYELARRIIRSEARLSHAATLSNLQSVISRHFAQSYYELLLLGSCHRRFHDDWLSEIQLLMLQNKSLYYSVLACSASHMYFSRPTHQMHELTLGYYSSAIKRLSRLVATTTRPESHNGLLMSIILLYLHGSMGLGTFTDIPRHLDAACQVLRLRLLNSWAALDKFTDRVAVESVLYHVFIMTTGMWHEGRTDYTFDREFWALSEALLGRSTFFPGRAMLNSPVLGIPVSLLRMSMSLRELFDSREPPDAEVLESYRDEVETWEGRVLSRDLFELDLRIDWDPSPHDQYCLDIARLFAIVNSIMFENLSLGMRRADLPLHGAKGTWKTDKAQRILRQYPEDDGWSVCYLGSWPVYTLGFFMGSPEGVDLVLHDLRRRWDKTKVSLCARYLYDLEEALCLPSKSNSLGDVGHGLLDS